MRSMKSENAGSRPSRWNCRRSLNIVLRYNYEGQWYAVKLVQCVHHGAIAAKIGWNATNYLRPRLVNAHEFLESHGI